MAVLRSVVHPLVSTQTWRRWAYLVLGGVVLAPFVFVAAYPTTLALGSEGPATVGLFVGVVLVLAAVVAVMSAVPVVRRMEIVSAKELLGGPIAGQVVPDVVSGGARARSGVFFCLHLLLGGFTGALTLTLVPLGVSWVLMPFTGWDAQGSVPMFADRPAAAVLAGLVVVIVFVYLCAGIGALLARWAPGMLGRSAAQRLTEIELLADDLSERNRIARDLHDSVGHALSVVTVQAGAARRLLETDPQFAREALGSVEDSARKALSELDDALGALRNGTGGSRTLAQVESLVRETETAGVEVRSTVAGAVESLPPVLSHEAFAIVQESLTNALRHAPHQPVDLVVTAHADAVEVEVSNPLPAAGGSTPRASGGRGIPGMRDRAAAVGGTLEAGAVGGRWRVTARLRSGASG